MVSTLPSYQEQAPIENTPAVGWQFQDQYQRFCSCMLDLLDVQDEYYSSVYNIIENNVTALNNRMRQIYQQFNLTSESTQQQVDQAFNTQPNFASEVRNVNDVIEDHLFFRGFIQDMTILRERIIEYQEHNFKEGIEFFEDIFSSLQEEDSTFSDLSGFLFDSLTEPFIAEDVALRTVIYKLATSIVNQYHHYVDQYTEQGVESEEQIQYDEKIIPKDSVFGICMMLDLLLEQNGASKNSQQSKY